MMRQTRLALVLLLSSSALAQAPAPKDGYVPDAKTAITIATAVLQGMQGAMAVHRQGQFCAENHDGVWQVSGRCDKDPHERGGGGLLMRIDKQTGQILGYYFAR